MVITFTGNRSIKFVYDATGAKLQKIVNDNVNPATTQYYVNGIEYNGNTLERIPHTEGEIVKNATGNYIYQYALKDHLGNRRVTFVGNTTALGTVAASDIKQVNHYYPFGMNMEGPAYSFSGVNKMQYNDKELNTDFGLNWNDYGARFYDASIGRWLGVDPLAEKYHNWSPYHYGLNNPIRFVDPTGMSSQAFTSTHTDSNGKVVAVYDDGDNGVYKHDNWEADKHKYSKSNTAAGGEKVGQTLFWDEFANHDAHGTILGINGNYANTSAHIGFDEADFDNEMWQLVKWARGNMEWFQSRSKATEWLKFHSKRYGTLDIKTRIGAHNGFKFKGYYVSGETLGNFLFGANLKSLKNMQDGNMFLTDNYVFTKAAKAFGAYHNESNHVSNPPVAPYFGEIPYSGRGVVLGFWNGNFDNPVFNEHGQNAYFGTKK